LDAGNNETLRTLSGPASKKRQGTKSREIGHWLAAPPRRPRPADVHFGSHKANSACRKPRPIAIRGEGVLPPLPLHNVFALPGPALHRPQQ